MEWRQQCLAGPLYRSSLKKLSRRLCAEGDGGNWGEGWDSDDGDEGGPWKIENMWAWQVICIASLLQVLASSDSRSHAQITFAHSLSMSIFASKVL